MNPPLVLPLKKGQYDIKARHLGPKINEQFECIRQLLQKNNSKTFVTQNNVKKGIS